MTDADKNSLTDHFKRGVAQAASRGLVVWGYRVNGDRLDLWTRPAERKRRTPENASPPNDVRPRVSRGVAQGSLL